MKLIYVRNAENVYTKQLREMKQLPSASKQYKLWLSALEDGNDTQKLFANCINVAGTLVVVKNIISCATNRYQNGYKGTKFISYVYLFQAAQKELKRIMYNDGLIKATPEQKAVRDAYAKYMRTELTYKQGGQIYTAKYEEPTPEPTPDPTPEPTPEK